MNAGETVPVTVLGGSLRVGKTTLLNHLLANAGDHDITVLISNMGSMNVDAELVAEEFDPTVGGSVTELSNGCIYCKLQGNLETMVIRLAREWSFGRLVVGASGASEPDPVARLFVAPWATTRYDVAGLTTVVDSRLFADTFDGGDPDRTVTEEGDGSVCPLSDLLVKQVGNTDLVVLNKHSLISNTEFGTAHNMIEAFHPGATAVETDHGDVGVDLLLSGCHDSNTPVGWRAALEDKTTHDDGDGGDHGRDEHADADRDDYGHGHTHHNNHDHDEMPHAGATYGITSFVYRHHAPLDPDDVAAALGDLPGSVVRAKRSLRVIEAEGVHYTYSQAGLSACVTAAGPWVASRPELEQDAYRCNRPDSDRHDDHGDRRTELVFTGHEMDKDVLAAALNVHLLDLGTSADTGGFPTDSGEGIVFAEPARKHESIPTADAVSRGRR